MSRNHQYLFIAGASRSGTTLLMNLLDSHRELLIFPLEHKVLAKYFTIPEKHRREYFTEAFITERSEGQQTVLASRELYEQYRYRIRREFGTDFTLDVDNDRFLSRYREILRGHDMNLDAILSALAEALAVSNPQAASVYPLSKYTVFKDPFTTEFFAHQASAELPSAKFLHIIRNPYARYCSIKKRRMRRGNVLKRQVSRRINFRDFATGYAEQAIASLHSGMENQRLLGRERYLIMRFEDLVEDPRASLQQIADWLGIEFDAALLQPSKLGAPVDSGSSFSPSSGIDRATADHGQQYFLKMTSASERDVYNRCLERSEYGRFYALMLPEAMRQSFFTWIKPYKRERVRDYFRRIVTGQGWERRDRDAFSSAMNQRLPRLYLSGRMR